MSYVKKRTETSIKNNEIEGWSRDGRAKKYTNKICRDNHVHYTFVRLLFLISYHVPVDSDSLVLFLTESYPPAIIMTRIGGGIDRHITAWLVVCNAGLQKKLSCF